MSANITFQNGLGLPPVRDIVQSLSARTATVLESFDAVSPARKQQSLSLDKVISNASPTLVWIAPTSPTPAANLRRGIAFALVVLVHGVAAYVLTHLAPQVKDIVVQPLQVAVLAAPQSNEEKPLPPPAIPSQPNISLPIEPVFLIAAEPTNAITVEARPVEPTTSDATTAIPKVVSTVEYVREPQPKYPPSARALKQRGTVMLRVLVDSNGHAREVSLHRTSGYRALDDAARTAVLNALFKPYTENGQSLPVYVLVPIEFGAA